MGLYSTLLDKIQEKTNTTEDNSAIIGKPKLLSKEQIISMKHICLKPINAFSEVAGWKVFNGPDGKYWYLDRGSKVLGVGHLDTVQQKDRFIYLVDKNGQESIHCPKLDDRLGVWVLVDHLFNELHYDILLTENEEMGRSTADYFKKHRYYNWVFEFDRKGEDVVMYQYESPRTKKELEKHGFVVGSGSYSDISTLERLEVKCFNFGVGYHNPHSLDAFAKTSELLSMIGKFKGFFNANKNKKFWHRKKSEKQMAFKRYSYYSKMPGFKNPFSDFEQYWKAYKK